MDPTSFTQTSFCGSKVDNITDNETKEYILNQLQIKCGGLSYKSRYAKVYNSQYKKNLDNPHILCLKSSGTPYLLFLTSINETNYTFLIDKRVKEGYSFPKIFSVPYQWHGDVYEGTLMECELIRDRQQNWCLSIGDIYYKSGENLQGTIIMERIAAMHQLFTHNYITSTFHDTCPPFIKRYFDYKDVHEIIDTFVPTLTYDIRGFYFVPLRCTYAKIVYLLPRDNKMNNVSSQAIPKVNAPPIAKPKNTSEGNKSESNMSENIKELRIMKTMKPDVYEVYSENGTLKKLGLALVQTTECSHKLRQAFHNKSQMDEVRLPCKYNHMFHKWCPV